MQQGERTRGSRVQALMLGPLAHSFAALRRWSFHHPLPGRQLTRCPPFPSRHSHLLPPMESSYSAYFDLAGAGCGITHRRSTGFVFPRGGYSLCMWLRLEELPRARNAAHSGGPGGGLPELRVARFVSARGAGVEVVLRARSLVYRVIPESLKVGGKQCSALSASSTQHSRPPSIPPPTTATRDGACLQHCHWSLGVALCLPSATHPVA